MAMTTLRTATAETVRPMERFAVRAKRAWSDSWQTIPYLVPLSAEATVAPRMGTARLRWDYGSIKREDKTTFSTYRPKDLKKWFVQILRLSAEGRIAVWHGLIPDEGFEVDGSDDVPSGTQEIRAVGLEYLLDRYTIEGARVRENDIEQTIERTPVFNLRHQYGLAATGNRSTDVGDAGVYVFSSDGAEWTNRDICQYLLNYHTTSAVPFRLSGQDEMLDNLTEIHRLEGLTVRQALNHLIDRHRGLGWCVRTDGDGTVYVQVFSVLGSALSVGDATIPANADRFSLALDDDITVSEAMVRVEEASQYDRIRVIGGPLKSCFTVSYADGTLEAAWTAAEEAAYAAGHTADDEDADLNDGERRTDKFLRVYQMYRLPQYFDWLVNDGEGGLAADQIANPTLRRDGTLDTDTAAATWNPGKHFERNIPFEVAGAVDGADPEYQTPLVAVYNETGQRWVQVEAADAAGVANGSCMVRPVDRETALDIRGPINHVLGLRHFGTEKVLNGDFSAGDAETSSADNWAWGGEILWNPAGYLDIDLSAGAGTVYPTPSFAAEVGKTYKVSATLTVDESTIPGAGCTISVGGASGEKIESSGTFEYDLTATGTDSLSLAFDNRFAGTLDNVSCLEEAPATNIDPVFDWQRMLATVMVATDERLRIDAYTSGYSDTSNPRVLTIDLDEAELWYVVPGTVTGITEGALVRSSAGSVERDDRPRMRLIAAMAAAWYGRYRSTVSITWRHVARYADLGQYLVDVSNSWQREEVGTPVTTVAWDFVGATTTLTTGFLDLDVTRMADLFPGMSDPRALGREIRAIRRDVRDLQMRVGNLPVRYIVSAGGGSGSSTAIQTLPVAYTGVY